MIKTFRKGEVIFEQGSYEPCMYDILCGCVGIYANYGTEQEKLLAELEAGKFFGEMGLIEDCPRSATAVALEADTRLEVITAGTFTSYFQEKPGMVLLIMQNMSQRIRSLTSDYLEACRTVSELMEAENEGREKSEPLKARLKKFMTDYADAVNEAAYYGYDVGMMFPWEKRW